MYIFLKVKNDRHKSVMLQFRIDSSIFEDGKKHKLLIITDWLEACTQMLSCNVTFIINIHIKVKVGKKISKHSFYYVDICENGIVETLYTNIDSKGKVTVELNNTNRK
jgi:hypothetical protein